MIREHYDILGVLSPDRVMLLGVVKQGVIVREEITLSLKALGTTIQAETDMLEYSIAERPRFWIEEFDGAVRIEDKATNRQVCVGLDYIKRAVEYFKVMEGERGSWKSLLKVMDVYLADEEVNTSPVVLVFNEYVAVIAPKIEEG